MISRNCIVKGAHVAMIQLREAPSRTDPAEGEDLVRAPGPRAIAIIARPVVVRRGVPPRVGDGALARGHLAGGDEALDAAGQHGVAADLDLQPLVDLGPEREVPRRQDDGRAIGEQGVRVPRGVVGPRARRGVRARDGEGVEVVVPVAGDAADVRVREGLRPFHGPPRPLRLHERADGHGTRHGEVILERLVGTGGVLREALRERDGGRAGGQTPERARRDGAGVVVEPDEDLPRDVPLVIGRGRERGAGPAVVDEADDLDLEGVRLPVAEQRQERRDVDLVLADVEGLDAHDGPVQLRHHAARVDDGERPRHAGEVPVDEHLHLAERRVARVLAVRGREGERGALRHVAPPELLVPLPLDVDGEDGAVRVAREVGHGHRRRRRRVHELAGLAGGAEALRDGDDEVGRGPRAARGLGSRGQGLKEGRCQRRVQKARIRPVHDVLEVEDHGLWLLPEGVKGSHVLEPFPADAIACRLRRGRPPDLGVAEVHDARAVVLSSPHERREVDDYVVEGALGRRVLACCRACHVSTRTAGYGMLSFLAAQLNCDKIDSYESHEAVVCAYRQREPRSCSQRYAP